MKTIEKSHKTADVKVKRQVRARDTGHKTFPGKEKTGSVMEKIEEILSENEDAIQLIMEVAAITLKKSNLSKRNKRIASAALLLLTEILNTEE